MEFTQALTAVREWLGCVTVPAKINRNTDEGLWVFFESENALAELIVGSDACAPWRFVSMTVLDTRLDPTRTILPFWDLLEGTPLLGLWIFLAVMPILVWRYYHYHTQGTMAVYTMRRLPDRWEYHRRCWTQPILSAIVELILYAILVGLCWLLWYFATPAPCRPF